MKTLSVNRFIVALSFTGLFLFQFIISKAQTKSDDEITIVRNFDFVFVSNSSTSGYGLDGEQIVKLENLLDSISNNHIATTNLVYYVCNGFQPDVERDYTGRSIWINKLTESNLYTLPQYSVDQRTILEDIWENDPFEAEQINIYYFFQDKFIANQGLEEYSDVTQFITNLPRKICWLVGADSPTINVHVFMPATTGQVSKEVIKNLLVKNNQFKNEDDSFEQVALYFN